MKPGITVFCLIGLSACAGQSSVSPQPDGIGKKLAFARDKGNCLACHAIDDGESPGDLGPPLTQLSIRFRNKQQLRRQIWDATVFNPETSMPPFGRNKILSGDEIDRIVDYLWSLD